MNFPLHFHIVLCLLIQKVKFVVSSKQMLSLLTVFPRGTQTRPSVFMSPDFTSSVHTCIHSFLVKNSLPYSLSISNSLYNACSLPWPCCIPDFQKTQLRSTLSLFQLKKTVLRFFLHYNQFISESILAPVFICCCIWSVRKLNACR